MRSQTIVLVGAWLTACSQPATPPTEPPAAAAVGRCGATIDTQAACGAWEDAVASCEGDADSHTSFPQLRDEGCYIPVVYEPGRFPHAAAPRAGCGYPLERDVTAEHLQREARRLDGIAATALPSSAPTTAAATEAPPALRLPMSLDCDLPDEVRASAARSNARTLRALARRIQGGEAPHPYALAATFGYGHSVMGNSALVSWRPDSPCLELDKREMRFLSVNIQRAGRAAAAFHGGVAPVVSFSGGAVHAPLYEAFMQMHLAVCRFAVPRDAVLVDPCADHTHTNFRNTGSLMRSLAARTAYVVTDDGLQGAYLQDSTPFSLLGGDIDQRSLRDWGYLLGSWHQASVGIESGFWFTPYRFWGEPRAALGSFSCVH